MFKEYYENIRLNTDKLFYNYVGISRKDYPKWEGWKIINAYKENNLDIKTINDKKLDILVENFYYIKYLEKFIN